MFEIDYCYITMEKWVIRSQDAKYSVLTKYMRKVQRLDGSGIYYYTTIDVVISA